MARHGFDEAVVASQGAANVGDVTSQRGFLDDRIGPDGIEQFLPGAEFAGLIDQQRQQIESFWGDDDGRAGAGKGALGRIEPEFTEPDGRSRFQ